LTRIKAAVDDCADTGGMTHPVRLAAAPPPRAAFLPKEHGSWSLVLEPVALGLLIAPSFGGGALATAAFAGFMARRPLKAALAPATPQRPAARRTVVLFSAFVLAGFVEVLAAAGWTPLWPLLPAAALGALFAWFDTQGESRAAAAETAGSAAFALLPAAIATVAGWPPAPALALTGLALARSVPTVLIVRTYLRIRKGETPSPFLPLTACTVALLFIVALGMQQLVPPGALLLGTVLWLRGGWLIGRFSPAWTARRLGLWEAGLGLIYITILVVSYRVGFDVGSTHP
jgi:YwiC-like protein